MVDIQTNPAGLHILYIEDDDYQQEIYGAIIRRDSPRHTLHLADNANCGLDELKSHPEIDCVLLDMNLPDMSGEEVLTQIKQSFPDMIVIAITGDDNEERAISLLQAGAEDYLIKQHYEQTYLMRSIRYALERQKVRKENNALHQQLDKKRILLSMQKEFVSNVSHEIRTPLAVINTSAHMMERKLDKTVKTTVGKYIDRIHRSVKSLEGIIENSLKFSSIEEGRISLSLEYFSLEQLLHQLVEQFCDMHDTQRVVVAGDAMPCDYYGDQALLEQVFSNLISNAIKYSPDNSTVTVYTVLLDDSVRVIVEDHGIGISQEDLPRIGDRFFRAENTKMVSGTGLGIYLSRSLLELHKGTLEFISEKGKGTKAVVTLPRRLGYSQPSYTQEQKSA